MEGNIVYINPKELVKHIYQELQKKGYYMTEGDIYEVLMIQSEYVQLKRGVKGNEETDDNNDNSVH